MIEPWAPPGPAATWPPEPKVLSVATQSGGEPEQPTDPASSNHACRRSTRPKGSSISSCSYSRPFAAMSAPLRTHPRFASQPETVPRHTGAQTFGEPLQPFEPAASYATRSADPGSSRNTLPASTTIRLPTPGADHSGWQTLGEPPHPAVPAASKA